MVHRTSQAGIVLITLLASGCSGPKTIDNDRMRSYLRSAKSFTAESDMLVDHVRQGRATRHYAQEHAAYLAEAVGRSAKELEQSVPARAAENTFSDCKTQLGLLHRELSGIRSTTDSNALDIAKQNLTKIRESLERAISQL